MIGALVIVVAIVVIVVMACVGSPIWRVPFVQSARTTLSTVRARRAGPRSSSPANFGSQLCYALCLGASLRVRLQHLTFANLLLINTGVSLFAGLMPIPGGIGVARPD